MVQVTCSVTNRWVPESKSGKKIISVQFFNQAPLQYYATGLSVSANLTGILADFFSKYI